MEKHIAGHTGKRVIKTKEEAYWIAKHNKFGKKMRAYLCKAEGNAHWHVTRMSKGAFYCNQRKDPKEGHRRGFVA